jgi:hypothetical protein
VSNSFEAVALLDENSLCIISHSKQNVYVYENGR